MLHALKKTWNALRRRNDWELDLEIELEAHLEARAADLVRRGMAPADAARRARLEMGSRENYREECRRSYGFQWLDEAWQDLRYAARTLRRSPGFAAVAVLSLALGIGANTIVFSFLHTLVLRPLPVDRPDEIVSIMDGRAPGHSFPTYRELRDHNRTLSGMIGIRVDAMGLDTDTGPRYVWGYLATGNYFDVLGVRPAVGRFFHAGDDRVVGASAYAVLSYGTWQSRFGGDPQIAGRTVRINKLPYTILGVAPHGFFGTETFYSPEIWVPMSMQPQIEGRASWLDNGGENDTWIVGRLQRGATAARAAQDLDAIGQSLAREFPSENAGMRLRVVKPGLLGDTVRPAVEAFVGGIMLLAGLVLLAACANLASLAAARAADRRFEIAIRLSIGASRGRILRQLFTESIAVSLIGGMAGCAMAFVALPAISRLLTPSGLPLQLTFSPDGNVLLFAVAASLFTGAIFGIAPARRSARSDPNPALRGASGVSGQRRWQAREVLLAGQVALCCFLLTASLVAARGLSRSLEMPVGFQPRGLTVAVFQLGLARYTPSEGAEFQRRTLEAVSQLPGVTSAAYGNSIPLSLNQNGTNVYRPDTVDFSGANSLHMNYYDISPGYLRTVRTRLLAGRDFTWHDDRHAPAVAIVNETFAREVLKTRDAVGQRFWQGKGRSIEVIGLVEDGKYQTLNEAPVRVLFRPTTQEYDEGTFLVVRSHNTGAAVGREIRRAILSLDAQLPLYAVGPAEEMLQIAYLPARAATMALGAFGVLALMLAITGTYGLAAYTVSRRVREIGIRVAIGARSTQVLRAVLGRIGVMLGVGSLLGLALGIVSARLLASIVYQATPRDPLVLGGVAVVMCAVALVSAWIPARRAISVDPIRSLRHE